MFSTSPLLGFPVVVRYDDGKRCQHLGVIEELLEDLDHTPPKSSPTASSIRWEVVDFLDVPRLLLSPMMRNHEQTEASNVARGVHEKLDGELPLRPS